MRNVWKYTLLPECTLEMPRGAQLLSVHVQGDDICLWALVDSSQPLTPRHFVIFGTGHAIHDVELTYIGTVMMLGGALVFHVFERE